MPNNEYINNDAVNYPDDLPKNWQHIWDYTFSRSHGRTARNAIRIALELKILDKINQNAIFNGAEGTSFVHYLIPNSF